MDFHNEINDIFLNEDDINAILEWMWDEENQEWFQLEAEFLEPVVIEESDTDSDTLTMMLIMMVREGFIGIL